MDGSIGANTAPLRLYKLSPKQKARFNHLGETRLDQEVTDSKASSLILILLPFSQFHASC